MDLAKTVLRQDMGAGNGDPGGTRPRRLVAFCLLTALGAIGDVVHLPMFFGVDQVFGSIFVLIATYLFGPWAGLASAAIAHAYTIVLWNHPYAYLIFCLEAVVVGVALRRWRGAVFLGDLAFWLVLGMPLGWVAYREVLDIGSLQALLIVLKQPANGLFNALVASLVILFLPVRRWALGGEDGQAVRFKDFLLTLIVAFVFFTSFATAMANSRKVLDDTLEAITDNLRTTFAHVKWELSEFVGRGNAAVARHADMILSGQPHVAGGGGYRAYVRVFANGEARAFDPIPDGLLERLPDAVCDGHLRVLGGGSPVLYQGRSVPDGCMVGLGSMESLRHLLKNQTIRPGVQYRVLDPGGAVLAQNLEAAADDKGKTRRVGDHLRQVFPADEGLPSMTRWKRSWFVFDGSLPETGGWRLEVRLSYAHYIDQLQEYYIQIFLVMFAVIGLALPVIFAVSRRVAESQAALVEATRHLPERVEDGRPIAWPRGRITEFNDTVDNIRRTADVLARSYAENRDRFADLCAEVIERHRAEAELRKLSLAVEQSQHAIVITDTGGTIEYVNPRFTELTGYASDEAIGRNPRILRSEDTPNSFYDEMWSTILAGRDWHGEIKDRCKDGTVFWAALSISPVRDEDGEITHFVAMHEDITARKLDEMRVQVAKEQAEVANRAKSELLANVSHELRTPLNAIIGFSDSMLQEIFGPVGHDKYREYIADIKGSGVHLLELINDILDVSAIEAGKMTLQDSDLDLALIAESCLRLVRPRADDAEVVLSADLEAGLPSLRGDGRRVKQVLINLLTNAVKFSPEGREVVLRAAVEEGGGLVVRVVDNGIGMDEAGIAKALEPFGQVESSLSRRYEGTGLGLPLCQRLMDLHGGSLEVASELGAGTTVTVRFPVERVLGRRGETIEA